MTESNHMSYLDIEDVEQARLAFDRGQLPDPIAMAPPRDQYDLQDLCTLLRLRSWAGATAPTLDELPTDDRCGFTGSRRDIWSWATPLPDRRPRYLLVGTAVDDLRLIDIYALAPDEWPRRAVEGTGEPDGAE